MSKISGMMNMGKQAMMNSQTALQTVGHNISNKSTEGFSRQRVEIKTNVPVSSGRVQYGTGARTGQVTRINNPFLEKQIQSENTSMGYSDSKADTLGRVEQVYNEQINKGLNQTLSEFFNAFREFSTNPESRATRDLVKETGRQVSADFNRINKELRGIQGDINQQIRGNVGQFNEYSKEVAKLNLEITKTEVAGAAANDQRDRRDVLLKKMGEIVNIKWAEGDGGQVFVTAGRSAIVVSGSESTDLIAGPIESKDGRGDVRVEVLFSPTKASDPMNITSEIKSGKIGGALEVRDQFINGILDDTDKLANKITEEVNALHRKGFNIYNTAGGNFFEDQKNVVNSAQNMKVEEDILKDSGKVAAAAIKNAPGDNRIANKIAELQYAQIMENKSSTLDEFYSAIVGRVGVTAKKAIKGAETQKLVIGQLDNLRESISGVSLDEEAAKMIEFQKAFNASARLITTADEMFDTVLSLKK